MKINEWQHLALVSNAGTLAIYYNGVSQTLNATSLVKPDNTPGTGITINPKIGHGDTTKPQDEVMGYMDEFRISTVARYTADFTPDTTAFSSDASTSFLMHATGAMGSDYIHRQ